MWRLRLSGPIVVVAAAVTTIAVVTELSANGAHDAVPPGINIGAGVSPTSLRPGLARTARASRPADPPVQTTISTGPATFVQSSPSAVIVPIETPNPSEPATTVLPAGTVPTDTTTTVTTSTPSSPPAVTSTTDDGPDRPGATTTVPINPVLTNPSTPSTTDR